MAGSWNHAVDNDGKLLVNEDLNGMLDTPGDWCEFAEEAYGMVYWLAKYLSKDEVPDVGVQYAGRFTVAELVEMARMHYNEGLAVSPGVDGHLPEDDE